MGGLIENAKMELLQKQIHAHNCGQSQRPCFVISSLTHWGVPPISLFQDFDEESETKYFPRA